MNFYIKLEQNYIPKLHTMMTHILTSWFKESTEGRKASFLKETIENTDLHKAIFNETMTTQEWCLKYNFVAPLKVVSATFLLFVFQV